MILIPELNYWFGRFLIQKNIDIEPFDIPVELKERDLPKKSVIELLFNDEWKESTYNYLFVEKKYFIPEIIRRRIAVRPNQVQIFESTADSTGVNLFNFTQQDLQMFDHLLQYRLNPNHSLDPLEYSDMTSNMSKLVFIYLDFKINGNWANYNFEGLISDPHNMLENMFEAYVIDQIYGDLSELEMEEGEGPTQAEGIEETEYITLTAQDIGLKYVDLTYEALYPTEVELSIKGGIQQIYGEDFIVKSDGVHNRRLSWADVDCPNGPGLESYLSEGDVLIVRYTRRPT